MALFGRKRKAVPVLTGESMRPLVERAVADLQAKTTAIDAVTHFSKAAWNVDQDAGTIVFTRDDGFCVTAPVQIIGTYDTSDGTWLWAWDNPSINPSLCSDAQAVLAYGKECDIGPLTTRKVLCQESDCWEFTALACTLCGAQGAYRGPAGRTHIFMTFGAVQLSKPSD